MGELPYDPTGPAVAAGCTMVLNPAPQTPLSSLALAGILKEAGLPASVITSDPATGARDHRGDPVVADHVIRAGGTW